MEHNDNIRVIKFLLKTYKFLQKSSLGHGGSIWDGALVLTKYLEKNFETLSLKYQLKDKSVLELGAGTGVCGICFSEFSSKYICLTDLKELKHLMEENIQINKNLALCEIKVEEVIWGKNFEIELEKIWNKSLNGFDVLLGSDLIDSSGKYLQDLIETLCFFFRKNPDLIMFNCYTAHKKETLLKFLELLKTNNLDFEEVDQEKMDKIFRSDDIGIHIIKNKINPDKL